MVVRFVLRKDSISFILAITKKWVIDVYKNSFTLYSSFYVYLITKEKKEGSQSLNSVWHSIVSNSEV